MDGDVEDTDPLRAKILKKLAQGVPVVPDPLIGSEVGGRFTIMDKVGSGGMGVVYRARQRGMDREVAIKVLLSNLNQNATTVRRFQLEALAVSKLRHPNTIQIFDFGETERQQLYIAMEFLDGSSLHDVLASEGALSAQRALRIAIQMARSLREAHSKGIIHRDLKPDNVFLCTVGEESDFVKVLDFGVAKLMEGDDSLGTLTQAGTIFGTPKYMSPEQAKAKEVDARSDLYAIGVILYEMLTGRLPFDGDNHMEVLIKHIQVEAPKFEDTRPDLAIPNEVQDVAYRLLKKPANERPQTAEALIREAEEVLNNLDDIYRNVVTRQDAVRRGLELSRTSSRRPDTVLEEAGVVDGLTIDGASSRSTYLSPGGARGRRPTWRVVLAVAAAVVLGGAGGVYLNLERLPEEFHTLEAVTAVDVGEVPEIQVDWVRVQLLSAPQGASIWLDADEVGTTPHIIEVVQGTAELTYTLKKEGFKDASQPVGFDEDHAVTVTLHPIRPERTTRSAPRSPETSGDRATSPSRPPVRKPEPRAPAPDPFGPNRRAGDLKRTSPF